MLRNIGFLLSYWFDKFTSVQLLKMLTTFAIIERTEAWIGNLRFSLSLSEEAFGYYRFPGSRRLKYKRNLKLKFLSKILKGLCDPLYWRFRILVLKFSFDVFFYPQHPYFYKWYNWDPGKLPTHFRVWKVLSSISYHNLPSFLVSPSFFMILRVWFLQSEDILSLKDLCSNKGLLLLIQNQSLNF